jgi:hypothetical protein
MGARPGAFGMLVVTVIRPASPHVLLPLEPRPEMSFGFGVVTLEEFAAGAERAIEAAAAMKPEPPTPDGIRVENELAASHTPQPWGWIGSAYGGQRVYTSVTGPRWVCCHNRFDEPHSPWCNPGVYDDPLPPA